MNLYIDESGNTGQSLIDSAGLQNFKDQPFFSLGGILVETDEIRNQLIELIDNLKKNYKIQASELKSKGIYETKPSLLYEIFEGFDNLNIPYFLELMDKKYYLSTQITNTYILPAHSLPWTDENIVQRRFVAEQLNRILPDHLFGDFCELCLNPTKERFESLFDELNKYFNQTNDETSDFFLKSLALTKDDYGELIAEGNPDAFKLFLPLPDADKRNRIVSILPNTHAFTNLIARCEKYRFDNTLPAFTVIHDEQKHFDEIFKSNLEVMKNTTADEILENSFIGDKALFKIPETVSVKFENSKQFAIIQIADLITGFMMRSWNDFYFGNFKSLNRYKSILKTMIFDEDTHQSIGVNMVVPELHYHLLIRYLRK